MDWMNVLSEFFQICIVPLLGVLTTYLVVLIKNKTKQVSEESDNALVSKYVSMLGDTITTCVLATEQTYVKALKQAGSFDAEAQKAALDMTVSAVKAILSEEAKVYLTTIYGDLEALITQKIEAEVKKTK